MPSAVAIHSHRPTTKVSHKSFKSKKATKGALREEAKGKFHTHHFTSVYIFILLSY